MRVCAHERESLCDDLIGRAPIERPPSTAQPNRLTGSTTNRHSYGHVAQLLLLGAPTAPFRVQQAPVCDSLCVYMCGRQEQSLPWPGAH